MRRDKYEDERGSGGNGGSSWISYSDMMASLMLVFVLMLCVSLLKYFTAPKEEDIQQQKSITEQQQELETREAELAEREAQLAKDQAELKKAQEQLKKDQEALQKAKEQLEKDQEALQKAQEQLKKDQAALQKAKEQLEKDQAELQKAQEQLKKDQEALQKAKEQLAKDQAELQKAQEQLKKDQDALQKAQEQLEKEQAELQAAQEQLAKDQEVLKAAQEQLAKDQAALAQLEKEQAELQAAQEQLAKDQAELKAAQEQLAKDQAALAQLEKDQAELQAAQEQLAKDQEALKAAQEQLAKDQAALAQLEKEQAELQAAQEQLAKDQEALKAAQEQLAKDQAELKAAQEQLAKDQAALAQLEKDQAELQAAQEQLAKDQQALEQEKKGLEETRTALEQDRNLLEEERAALETEKEQLKKDQAGLKEEQDQLNLEREALLDQYSLRNRIIASQYSSFENSGLNITINHDTGDITTPDFVLFNAGRSVLSDEGKQFLDVFIPLYLDVLMRPEYESSISGMTIEGYTDSLFPTAMELSRQRALQVMTYSLQIPTLTEAQRAFLNDKVSFIGRGFTNPVLDESGQIDQEASRRVEVRFQIQENRLLSESELIGELISGLDAAEVSAFVNPETGDVLPDGVLFFNAGEDTLTEEGKTFIREFLPVYLDVLMKPAYQDQVEMLIIEGMTDLQVQDAESWDLSQQRAAHVMEYCMQLDLTEAQKAYLQKTLTTAGRNTTDLTEETSGQANENAGRHVKFRFRLKNTDSLTELRRLLNDN